MYRRWGVKREEYARGSMFKNYREDWVSGPYDYDFRYLFETNGAYTVLNNSVPVIGLIFPSLALGWVISNEKFLEKYDWVDNLKLRYSIGKVGDDRVGGGRWQYSTMPMGYARLSNLTNGASPYNFYRESVVRNPNISGNRVEKQFGCRTKRIERIVLGEC